VRKTLLSPLSGLALMVLGFRALELEGKHIYGWSPYDYLFKFLAGLGLFLLFLAFAFFMGTAAYFSRRLSPIGTFLAGIAVLIAAVGSWTIVQPLVNVHYWTFSLLVVPLTCFLSGAVFSIVGVARLIVPKLHRH